MQNKGKLPITGLISLEGDQTTWRLLTNNLITNLKTTGILEKEPGKKIKINIVIDLILPPKRSYGKNTCRVNTSLREEVALGLARCIEFINDHLTSKQWLFNGYIDGENKVPIFIVYFESINLMIYTQKLKTEDNGIFFSKQMLN